MNDMDRNANVAENVLVDLDQELEHIRGFICGCRFTSEEHTVVFARKQPSDDKQRFDLQHRRGVYPPAALPTEPPPPGLNIHQ
ncbi:hypothetical protein NP493_780g01007 [Ridgeia piscesae]|uniref:Uncharacterized protein n=1 Tax=Ridgeia piscesae TaxID=27915 RepID=A0AAD9KND4_RIDPI|nr:hypothetical protein NP493_780g01007 [Ridgeia piscesae]